MPVVSAPQLDQITKRHLRITLSTNPVVLVVTLKHNRRRVLTDHEAPMVIARRIDEMTENLAGAPTPILRTLSGSCFVRVTE